MSDLISQACDAINAKLPEGGLGPSIVIEIKDEGTILITDQAAATDSDADCRLIASARTFQGLMDGSTNPMTAVMLGRLKVKGDASAALKLGKIFG